MALRFGVWICATLGAAFFCTEPPNHERRALPGWAFGATVALGAGVVAAWSSKLKLERALAASGAEKSGAVDKAAENPDSARITRKRGVDAAAAKAKALAKQAADRVVAAERKVKDLEIVKKAKAAVENTAKSAERGAKNVERSTKNAAKAVAKKMANMFRGF